MKVTIVGAGNMGRGIGTRTLAGGHQLGDDQAAKQQVAQLVADGGLRPIDVGPLRRAQQLEQLGFLHISLQQPLGLGFGSAIRLLPS